MIEPALHTLQLPFQQGLLSFPVAPARALFLRARAGLDRELFALARIDCEQSFKPWADALERIGMALAPSLAAAYPCVLLLPPRQRDEARATLARAFEHAGEHGVVIAAQHNDEGARTLCADMERVAGDVRQLSKHHCRAVWSLPSERVLDRELMAQWRELDAPRAICDGRFLSRPGLFNWERIDPGSALLIDCLPRDLAGQGADLGAGYGYLAAEVLTRCPAVSALHLYEAESRALELARINLAAFAARALLQYHWHDVCAGLTESYDFIVSNPPFHEGRADQPLLGLAFIRAAAAALRPGGRFLMVANRHLPYESEIRAHFASLRLLADAGGFKVLEGRK